MQGAFNRLKDIEQRCLERVKDMPSVDGVTDEWTGIGFKVAGISLLTRMDEVTEILDIPAFTRVPGVKPWVVGIANVRGGLLPLMDLKRFVTGQPVNSVNASRVMVVNHNGLHTGLVVEEIQGMRHFSLSEQAFELPDVNNRLKPYIKQAFKKDKKFWPVFSLHALVEDERFLQASL